MHVTVGQPNERIPPGLAEVVRIDAVAADDICLVDSSGAGALRSAEIEGCPALPGTIAAIEQHAVFHPANGPDVPAVGTDAELEMVGRAVRVTIGSPEVVRSGLKSSDGLVGKHRAFPDTVSGYKGTSFSQI